MPTYDFIFLALILPGFISHYIYTDLGQHKKIQSQLGEVVQSLLYSILTIVVTYYCFIKNNFQIYTFKELANCFSETSFAFYYMTITVFISIFIGVFWRLAHDNLYEPLVNKIRGVQGKSNVYNIDSLVKFFADGKEHAISIIDSNDKTIIEGFYSGQCFYNEVKEIQVSYPQNIERNRECFSKDDIKNIYFDMNNGIRIIEYRLDKFNKKFPIPPLLTKNIWNRIISPFKKDCKTIRLPELEIETEIKKQ